MKVTVINNEVVLVSNNVKITLSENEAVELMNKLFSTLRDNFEKYELLKSGDTVYYVDTYDHTIEKGTVFNVDKDDDGNIISISIDFENDFDEFTNVALGSCIFINKNIAEMVANR